MLWCRPSLHPRWQAPDAEPCQSRVLRVAGSSPATRILARLMFITILQRSNLLLAPRSDVTISPEEQSILMVALSFSFPLYRPGIPFIHH